MTPLPGATETALHATWGTFSGDAPHGAKTARYIGGGVVLLMLLAVGLVLGRHEGTARTD
ncbi:MAG: hypothetical protein M3R06_00090 [Chloroflexota bacterium]|nr:hypothetical protein [Chloroflexota bacterium]